MEAYLILATPLQTHHVDSTLKRRGIVSTWNPRGVFVGTALKMKYSIMDFFSICNQMRRTKFILAKFANQKNAGSLSSFFVPLSGKSLSIYCMTRLKRDTCISMRLPFTKMMFHSLCRTCALGYG